MAATTKNQPDMIVYHVKERGEGKKAIWTRIGVAWKHENGEGFNQRLDFYPAQAGNIVMLPPKAEDNAEDGE